MASPPRRCAGALILFAWSKSCASALHPMRGVVTQDAGMLCCTECNLDGISGPIKSLFKKGAAHIRSSDEMFQQAEKLRVFMNFNIHGSSRVGGGEGVLLHD